MECFNCGRRITRERFCPACNTDLVVYRRLVGISNYLYNRAIGEAKNKNMFGAIEDLKMSLGYNKTNTDARNLLGLCYYHIGEEVEAIKQWLISTVFQRSGNRAEHYLDITRREPSENERINTYVRKYNQALGYAQDENYDMAKIQLKKCVAINPNHVRAYQLIALLEMMTGAPDAAIRYLNKANEIDKTNPISAKYMREAEGLLEEMDDRQISNSTIYQSGNETIIQPKHRLGQSIWSIVINVLVGIGIGAAVTAFIVIPNIRNTVITEANANLDDANETISDKNQQIKALEDQVAALEGKTETASSDIKGLQDSLDAESNLARAYYLYHQNDVEATMDAVNSVDAELLTEESKAAFTELRSIVTGQFIQQAYDAGIRAYESNNTETAAKHLLRVVTADETYDSGNALYTLAQAYRKQNNIDEAIKCYERVVDLFPDSSLATNANIYIEQLNNL